MPADSVLVAQIATRADAVRQRIAAAAARAGRDADAVTLVAVTKTHPIETVRAALDAGLRDLGENRVQELRDKFSSVRREARWHMIGHLQSNKTRDAVRLFSVVQSVDRVSLADKLDQSAREIDKVVDVLQSFGIFDV